MEKNHVCPWQSGPMLTMGLRKLFNNPIRITAPYLAPGMIAMDIGPGMGFFTIPMAGLVSEQGKVIAVDLQPQMLEGLMKNAREAGRGNITPHLCASNSLRVEQWNGTVDFALMFWMLHEVPDAQRLIREIHAVLAPGGKLLFAEPIGHVGSEKFQRSLNMIKQVGFSVTATPKIPICRTAVLQKI